MRIFIDCEFNEFKGELISMALVAEDGSYFYESLGCDNPGSWVAKNVMPIIGVDSISLPMFQEKMYRFLNKYDRIHVIADWPEDIKHFCAALITGPGERLGTPPLTMEILRIDAESKLPHNALADAQAIADAVLTHEYENSDK